MQYDVLKDVIIDGTAHKAGALITINHDKTDRLVLLGFIIKHEGSKYIDRSVGLTEETAPRKRKKKDDS